jgi:hypothetical protein
MEMNKNRFGPIWCASLLLVLVMLACNTLAAPAPTAISTYTAAPLPTEAKQVGQVVSPTEAPVATETQQTSDQQARIQKYVDAGYLSSDQGNINPLTDGSFDLAKLNYLMIKDAGFEEKTRDFAAWTHVKLSSAAPVNYPEYSGCGFTFRLIDNGDSYRAMVTKDRVLMAVCRNTRCTEVGKTKGSGRLSYDNNFEADVELVVNDTSAHVLVDGQSIGDYTLSGDYLTDPGYVAYTVISGTNKDYGTRCEFSKGGLWTPQQ